MPASPEILHTQVLSELPWGVEGLLLEFMEDRLESENLKHFNLTSLGSLLLYPTWKYQSVLDLRRV